MAAHDAVTLWDSLPRAGRKDEPNDEVVALVRVADGHLSDQHDTITEAFTVWNPLTREARWLPEDRALARVGARRDAPRGHPAEDRLEPDAAA